MRKIQVLAIVVFLFPALSFASWAGEFDYVEIKEALEAGLLSVSFTGSEDEEKMEIRIERILSMPLIVVINKGSTTFPHSYGEISIMTDERILVDLSKGMQDTIIVSQTGKGRMRGTMNQRARFSQKTAVLYSKLKYSKDHMLTQLIAALDQEDTRIRSGAAEALGEIGDKRAVTRLKKLFANDPDRDVRKAAGEALEKIRNSKESITKSSQTGAGDGLFARAGKINTPADAWDVTLGAFSVKVPSDWRSFSAGESDQFRRQYMAQSEEIYRQYSGAPNPAKSVDIAAFHIAGDESAFVIVSFKIPPQSDLINLLKKEAEEKAKWGIQQGYIQKYLGLVPLDDKQLSGFYVKFVGTSGEVQISGGLEHKKLKSTLVQLTLLCPKAWDELKATNTLTSILESVKLRER